MNKCVLPLKRECRGDGALKPVPKAIATAMFAAGFKRCNRCQWFKPLDEFSSDSSRADGLSNKCKPCDYKKQRDYLIELDRIDPARAEDRRRAGGTPTSFAEARAAMDAAREANKTPTGRSPVADLMRKLGRVS